MVNLFKNDSEVRKKRQFDLGWGARSPKKLAQKLLAVAVCAAMVLLGVPLTGGRYVGSAADLPVVTLTLSKDATTGKYSLTGVEELDKHAGQKVRIKVECEGFEVPKNWNPLSLNELLLASGRDVGGRLKRKGQTRFLGTVDLGRWAPCLPLELYANTGDTLIRVGARQGGVVIERNIDGEEETWDIYGSGAVGSSLEVWVLNDAGESGPPKVHGAELNGICRELPEGSTFSGPAVFKRTELPLLGDAILQLRDGLDGNTEAVATFNLVDLGFSNWPAAWERALGVSPVDKHGVLLYISEDGTTSTPVTGAAMQYLYDSAGVSGAAGSWFALDNSNGTFEEGSRFWLRWLVQGDEGFDEEIAKLDESVRASVDLSKVRMLVMGVDSPDGVPYTSWDEPVDFYVPVEDGWTEADVRARFLSSALDEDVSIRIEEYVFPGETAARRVAVLSLKHFSPYLVYDEVTEEERALPDVSEPSPKTGDVVTAATVGGLGVVLVMALGVMLCLVVRRRNDMR